MTVDQAAKIKAMYDIVGCQNKARKAFNVCNQDELAKLANFVGPYIRKEPIELLEGSRDNNSYTLYACRDLIVKANGQILYKYEGDFGVSDIEFDCIQDALDYLKIDLSQDMLNKLAIAAIFGYEFKMIKK